MIVGLPVIYSLILPTISPVAWIGFGYWIALSDGFVVPCGRAIFHGRIEEPEAPIVSIISNHDGNGYWLIDATGNVFPFGEIGGFDAFGETVEGFTGQIVSATPVT